MDAGISMPSVIGEIAGPYREFAEMVRQIVGERSLRQAQIKTGVSHTTIGDMMKGIRPKEATIRLFAAGFDTDSQDLLRAAGYPVRSLPALPKTRENSRLSGRKRIETFRTQNAEGPGSDPRPLLFSGIPSSPIQPSCTGSAPRA